MMKAGTYILNMDGPCNQKCLFCMRSFETYNKPKKSYASIINEIQTARHSGYKKIDFFGGEPTTYLRLKDIIHLTNNLGLEATLASNAMMFASNRYTKEFFAVAELSGIRSSIHSHNPQVHDKITQVPGSWEKTIAGVKNILKFNQKLSFNIVITSLNYGHLPEIVGFVHSCGVRGIKFSGICMEGRILENKHLCVNLALIEKRLVRAINLAKKLGFTLIEAEKIPKDILMDNALQSVRYIED